MEGKTAVYRQHGGGITKNKFIMTMPYVALFMLYEKTNAYLNYRYNATFRKQLFHMSKTILIYGSRDKKGWARQKHIFQYFKEYFKYQSSLDLKEFFYYLLVLYCAPLLELANRKEK